MDNDMLNPNIIMREIVRLIPSLTGRNNFKTIVLPDENFARYSGVLCNLRCYKNDDNFYFDIYAGEIEFTISLPMFSIIWKWSIDDFAEHKLVPELYKKLDYYGFATWD